MISLKFKYDGTNTQTYRVQVMGNSFPHNHMVQIYCFNTGDTVLFKHYFENEELFNQLQDFYDNEEYRFEIPVGEFSEYKDRLEAHGYDVEVIEELEPFCVVKEQYTPYAEILKRSVLHWNRGGQNFFLMKDRQAVEFAINEGAQRIEETEFVVGL